MTVLEGGARLMICLENHLLPDLEHVHGGEEAFLCN